ncbi:hypothetical protein ACFQAT_05045 [Undibacterium arcticum]|uniref:Uncharacterized protein n=1 Tax=Undibacterium arcticum TaxID=1762892 RepID=A0ABV7F9C9_9BURK
MKSYLSSIIGAVVGCVHRRRLDALRRCTSENGMWQITECPDFLDRHRQHPPELVGEGGADARNHAVDVSAADGRMCFVLDGDRVVFLGTRK